jgi:hypothetical protein
MSITPVAVLQHHSMKSITDMRVSQVVSEGKDHALIKLALLTLGDFDFSGTAKP